MRPSSAGVEQSTSVKGLGNKGTKVLISGYNKTTPLTEALLSQKARPFFALYVINKAIVETLEHRQLRF